VLVSEDGRRTYTGHTSNVERRVREHNAGEVRSSKGFRPYKILKIEAFLTLKEAKAKELYYKNFRGREKIKRFIEEARSRG